ncbi:hypothetical protein [Flagellimonas pelagia]|uniref:Transporter n=1 Tax=Flagellimonas pelagia TaxID=2306998 RepID=A0A3A1NF33_9FLAO|nr:hypothetical protein [Allomuricauda maritima]RIV41834.1 hypothetical protein D2V05_17060 [Allomuricauda maritima]TXJ90710.1 hypothetical protein FQ017_16910 [Allomuricauda maritima]
MKRLLLVSAILLFSMAASNIFAQGCVAIRGFSTCSGELANRSTAGFQKGQWSISGNFRHFKSFRHFVGTEEQVERVEEHTNVINRSSFYDLSIGYSFTDRLFGTLIIPYVDHSRESGRDERSKVYSQGLGDIRASVGYWLFDFNKQVRSNLSISLGIKTNSGKSDFTDVHAHRDGRPDERPVDQSIQPGDGGVGFTFELQGYHLITNNLFVTGGFYYLVNPREMNGVPTYRSRETEAIMSVPDQLAGRAGLTYIFGTSGFGVYGGGRYECVPVYDLIGGSGGFRRPGYVLSAEPGLSYTRNKFQVNVDVPIALVRNRTQSFPDMQTEAMTGESQHGDAAFADYLVSVGVTYRFGGKGHANMPVDVDEIEPTAPIN